jgi:Mn2+/Fe2+ NRAMP family transporter
MRGMNRILMFVFLVIVSAICFYFVYGLDPSIMRQISPIKNDSIRNKMFTVFGVVLLLSALLLLYAAIMSPR